MRRMASENRMASESGQKITSRMGLDLCTPILRRPLYSPYDLHRIPTGRHPNFPPVDPSSIHVGFWSLVSMLTTSRHSHSTIPPFIYLVGLSFPLRTSASRCSKLDHFPLHPHRSAPQVHHQLHPTFQFIFGAVPHPRLYSFWIHFPSI